MLQIGLAHSALRERRLTEEELALVVREVAGHPYELNLFLRNAARDLDIAPAIRAVHRQTGEYAALAYYVGRAGDEERQILEFLAALDAAEHKDLIIQVWRALGPARGWSTDTGIPAWALESLARQGLVEAQDDHVHILPVLRAYLLEPGSSGITGGAEPLHRDLARFFFALADAIQAQIKARLRSDTPSEEQDRDVSILSQQHIEYLHRAARQALAQDNLALAGELLQALCHHAAGRIPALRIVAFARGLEAKLGRLTDPAEQEAVIGACYGVIGTAFLSLRQWPEALENYGKAIEWKEKTGQHHELGSTYHQVGMVYEEQGQWPEALENYGKAIEWKDKTGQHHELGGTYHQVGRVYEEQGDLEQAAGWYARALEAVLGQKPRNPNELEVTLRSAARVAGTVASESEAVRKLRTLLSSLTGGIG